MRVRQAAAIPFRLRDGAAEFCLITTSSGERWTVPKGVIERGADAAQTALQEAHEEAGLGGEVVGKALGSYTRTKWGTTFLVEVYLMRVTAVDEHWEERHLRQRRWLVAPDALGLIGDRPIGTLFRSAVASLERDCR